MQQRQVEEQALQNAGGAYTNPLYCAWSIYCPDILRVEHILTLYIYCGWSIY